MTSHPKQPQGEEAGVHIMTREEWERRYAARLMERGGLEERLAIQCGKDAAAECERWERAAGNAVDWSKPEDNPEDAADEEMSYWEDDGATE